MKILPLTFSLLPLLYICGCSNPDKKALDSFKPIIAFLGSQTNSDGKIEYSDFSYNVEKTDSLVSPFTGVTVFKRHIVLPDGKNYSDYIFTCHFAQQDGKWVHKSIDVEKQETEEGKKYEAEYQRNETDEVRAKQDANSAQISQLGISISKMSLDSQLAKFLNCPKTITDSIF
jgi:hypothetical protein